MAKRRIVLTEKELKNLLKEVTKKLISETSAQLEDDLIEYARLGKKYTGLNVEVYVDDGGAYMRHEHPLWIYVRDGYTNYDPVFHIEVSENPTAPSNTNIHDSDLKAVLRFITQNVDLLKAFANDKISHMHFYRSCRPVGNKNNTLHLESINEMATLKRRDSGLPTDLWIDEGSDPKHGPRIKFQASKEQVTTNQYSTMTISQEPVIMFPPKKYDLKTKDIQRIVDFVKANEALLISVSRGEITYEEFLANMTRT